MPSAISCATLLKTRDAVRITPSDQHLWASARVTSNASSVVLDLCVSRAAAMC